MIYYRAFIFAKQVPLRFFFSISDTIFYGFFPSLFPLPRSLPPFFLFPFPFPLPPFFLFPIPFSLVPLFLFFPFSLFPIFLSPLFSLIFIFPPNPMKAQILPPPLGVQTEKYTPLCENDAKFHKNNSVKTIVATINCAKNLWISLLRELS